MKLKILLLSFLISTTVRAGLVLEPVVGYGSIAQNSYNTAFDGYMNISMTGLSFGGRVGYKNSIVTYGLRGMYSPSLEVEFSADSSSISAATIRDQNNIANIADYSLLQIGPYLKIQSTDMVNVFFGIDVNYAVEVSLNDTTSESDATNVYVGVGINPISKLSLNFELGYVIPEDVVADPDPTVSAMLSASVPIEF